MKDLNVYIDETGNNFFDPNQWFFIKGVLICKGDFELKYGDTFNIS